MSFRGAPIGASPESTAPIGGYGFRRSLRSAGMTAWLGPVMPDRLHVLQRLVESDHIGILRIEVDLPLDQLGSEGRHALELQVSPALFHHNVLSLYPTQLPHLLPEGLKQERLLLPSGLRRSRRGQQR